MQFPSILIVETRNLFRASTLGSSPHLKNRNKDLASRIQSSTHIKNRNLTVRQDLGTTSSEKTRNLRRSPTFVNYIAVRATRENSSPHVDFHITAVIPARVHVELAPRRCEAVTVSRGRRGAGRRIGKVGPGHDEGVVDVQVTEVLCKQGKRMTGCIYSRVFYVSKNKSDNSSKEWMQLSNFEEST